MRLVSTVFAFVVLALSIGTSANPQKPKPWKAIAAALVFACLALGCAGPARLEPGDSFDVSGLEGREDAVAAALSEWNAAGGLRLTIGGADWSFKNRAGIEGHFDTARPVIEVDADRMTDDRLTMVIAHEIGHTLGLDHLSGGLMAKGSSAPRPSCIDQIAVDALREARPELTFRVTCPE